MTKIINPRRSRYTYVDRRVKKSRRRLMTVAFFGVVFVLLCGYGIASLGKEIPVASSEANPLPLRPQLNKAQLAWPAVGQAAIGSVEDGLLAQSSQSEALRPTASMAKVITALAILEKRPLKPGQAGQTYTLTSEDVRDYHAEVARGGSVIPVYDGMVLTQYEAMQAMLIASGNNIADMLVKVEFGSIEAYTAYAQDMLRHMELHRTIVADASGYSSATVSAPSELVMIGIAALKNPVIAEIVAQPHAQIPGVGSIKNTNELLGTEGAIGIKTGTADEAGSCLLFAAHYKTEDEQEMTIVGVIMGDTDADSVFSDSSNLLTSIRRGFGLADPRSTNNTADSPTVQEGQTLRQ